MIATTKINELDEKILERLNQEYVNAFLASDADWYRRHLADDFVCIESDGSVLTRSQFISHTAKGPDVSTYSLESVEVRVFGEVGLVRATGIWSRKDGSMGISRYTDVYVKRDAEWKTVSAQVTRVSRTGPRGRYKRSQVAS